MAGCFPCKAEHMAPLNNLPTRTAFTPRWFVKHFGWPFSHRTSPQQSWKASNQGGFRWQAFPSCFRCRGRSTSACSADFVYPLLWNFVMMRRSTGHGCQDHFLTRLSLPIAWRLDGDASSRTLLPWPSCRTKAPVLSRGPRWRAKCAAVVSLRRWRNIWKSPACAIDRER
jgi:hypothetical protein